MSDKTTDNVATHQDRRAETTHQDRRTETAEVLLETAPAIMGYVSSELRRRSPVDNNVHFRLLRTLRRRRQSLHELAELHAVRLPTMSRTVSVLEERGWIERVRSTEDRRTVFAEITEAGTNALAECEQMAIHRATTLLECLDDRDVESLRAGLATLYQVMQEQLGPLFEQGEYAPSAASSNAASGHDASGEASARPGSGHT